MYCKSEKLVVHLARDEKFIDVAMRSFELNGCKNELYVYGSHKCKYIRSEVHGRIRPYDSIFGRLAWKLKHADLVVVHSLNEQWVNIVLKIPKRIPVLWLGIGGDYYSYLYPRSSDLLLEETLELINSNKKPKGIKDIIKILVINIFIQKNFLRAINRINYFSPILFNEYNVVKNKFRLDAFPKQVVWQYGNLEDDLIKGYENECVDGNNILIGNSSSETNNHIDAFTLLEKVNLKGKVIISPLSYGDETYRDIVTSKAIELFGNNFEALIDFIPIEIYIEKIKSCGFVLMNHVRQQALGNIVIMLYLGAKVFLREENPIYKFLKGEGALIYSIQDLETDKSLLEQRLNSFDMKVNKEVIINNFSKSVVDSKTKKMLELIFDCQENFIEG